MTTTFDTDMAAVVAELLAEFGPTATLSRKVEGVYDPGSGSRTPTTTTTYSVKVSPPESLASAREHLRSQGLGGQSNAEFGAGAGSRVTLVVYMETVDTSDATVPRPDTENDTLTLYGEVYQIVEVAAVYSGDDVATYALGLAR